MILFVSFFFVFFSFFFFNDTATTEIYTLSLHDALPILGLLGGAHLGLAQGGVGADHHHRAAAGERRVVLHAGDRADDHPGAAARPWRHLARLEHLTVQPPHRRAAQVPAELLGDLAGGAQPRRARLCRAAARHQHVGALAAAERGGDRPEGTAVQPAGARAAVL